VVAPDRWQEVLWRQFIKDVRKMPMPDDWNKSIHDHPSLSKAKQPTSSHTNNAPKDEHELAGLRKG